MGDMEWLKEIEHRAFEATDPETMLCAPTDCVKLIAAVRLVERALSEPSILCPLGEKVPLLSECVAELRHVGGHYSDKLGQRLAAHRGDQLDALCRLRSGDFEDACKPT